jgi:hypothetical protein
MKMLLLRAPSRIRVRFQNLRQEIAEMQWKKVMTTIDAHVSLHVHRVLLLQTYHGGFGGPDVPPRTSRIRRTFAPLPSAYSGGLLRGCLRSPIRCLLRWVSLLLLVRRLVHTRAFLPLQCGRSQPRAAPSLPLYFWAPPLLLSSSSALLALLLPFLSNWLLLAFCCRGPHRRVSQNFAKPTFSVLSQPDKKFRHDLCSVSQDAPSQWQ